MKLQDVIDEVKAIKGICYDNEWAHGREDQLHQDVLQYIADGGENPSAYAREALKTLTLQFDRWYA